MVQHELESSGGGELLAWGWGSREVRGLSWSVVWAAGPSHQQREAGSISSPSA